MYTLKHFTVPITHSSYLQVVFRDC